MVFFSILAIGGGAGGQSPHVLVPKNTCKGIIDNTCDIRDFRAHIFCPQTTQELYLRSTMKQDRLNNCLLMHCHKSITDTLATMKIAKRFACANEQRKGHLKKNLRRGMSMAEWKMSALPPPPPPPPHEFQQLRMHLFCFNPPTLRAKYEFKHIEIDLLLAPVVQKVDSAIHRRNLYSQDGAIAFPKAPSTRRRWKRSP